MVSAVDYYFIQEDGSRFKVGGVFKLGPLKAIFLQGYILKFLLEIWKKISYAMGGIFSTCMLIYVIIPNAF